MEATLQLTSLFRSSDPWSKAEIAKALAVVEATRTEAVGRLISLDEERIRALLTSTDEEVDRIEAEQTKAARELDRTDAALIELKRRLGEMERVGNECLTASLVPVGNPVPAIGAH